MAHVAQDAADVLPATENVPPGHAEHVALWASAYSPASQIVQSPAPVAAAYPAAHGVLVALPSQS